MSRILAATYGAGHVKMLIPVLKELQSRGHDVIVLALTAAWGPVERAGLKSIGFRDFLNGHERALAIGRLLAQDMPGHPEVHPEETVAYMGLSYLDLENRLGEKGAKVEFDKRERQAFLPLGVLRQIFDSVQPDIVMATSSPRAERATVMVARERGIPALVIADLMPQMEMEWMGDPSYGDTVCVISEGVRRKLIRAGRDENKVVATGNPVMDEHFEINVEALREKWRTKHKVANSERVALYASQPDPDRFLGSRIAAELVEHGAMAGWKVAVRPHPNEDFDTNLLPKNTIISGQDETPWDCLCGADGCIVISSTMGIQAVLVGCPLVSYDAPVNMNPTPFPEFEIGRIASTGAEVFTHLNEIYGCGNLMGQGLPEGRATDRVVNEVLKLLG